MVQVDTYSKSVEHFCKKHKQKKRQAFCNLKYSRLYLHLICGGISQKAVKTSADTSHSVASWELEEISKGHQWSKLYNPLLGKNLLYIHLSVPMFFFSFSLEGLLECACISTPTLTAQQACSSRRSRKVGSPAETLPICGAGLGPSHLNLAGLTWNSLPVGLPQTLPLSQGRRPHCKPQQLMSATPPESWLQLTSKYLSRKKEVIRFYHYFLVEVVKLLVFCIFFN